MIQLALEEHNILVGNRVPFLNGKRKTLNSSFLCKPSLSKDFKGKQFKKNHTVHANDYDKLIHQNSVCSVAAWWNVSLFIHIFVRVLWHSKINSRFFTLSGNLGMQVPLCCIHCTLLGYAAFLIYITSVVQELFVQRLLKKSI